MEGPRAPSISEYPQVVDFLDEALRPEATWSIQDEYPTALNPRNLHNIRIIRDGEAVLSHAVLRPTLIKTPLGIFKVGAIGSVVTDTRYRNQGLSRKILDECLGLATEQACDFAILWTDMYEFYRKFGFELSGTELSFQISNTIPSAANLGPTHSGATPMALQFKETNQIDPSALYRVFSQHSVSTIRTVDEIRKYLTIPNARVYTAWDQKGQLVAYAVEGKGADLGGYIHEWGGSLSNIIPLLNFILSKRKTPFTVIVPSHCQNLVRALTDSGHLPHSGFLGMIKIVQTRSLFSKIVRYAQTTLGIKDFILEKRDQNFIVGLRDKPYSTPSEQDMVKLIFGPGKASDAGSMDPATCQILERVFPLQMWMWGWDSV